jgi:ketosteroid isomerase-like protein
MKKPFLTLIVTLVLEAALNGGYPAMNYDITDPDRDQQVLLHMDKKIATASSADGILNAFYPHLAENAALFPLDGHPIQGKAACETVMKREDIKKKEPKPSWEPLFADVSAAKDLGYTHGRFKKGPKETDYGYYGTIWRKDPQAKWRVVVSQGLIDMTGLDQKLLDPKLKIDPAKVDKVTQQVLATELAFSNYSVKNGVLQAFHRYIADTGIALSFSGPPSTKKTYAAALASQKKNETGKNILTWEPFYSFAAASGDLAYNFGPYTYTVTDAAGKTLTRRGYFITVWKRQPDQSWKFVFDGGNVLNK